MCSDPEDYSTLSSTVQYSTSEESCTVQEQKLGMGVVLSNAGDDRNWAWMLRSSVCRWSWVLSNAVRMKRPGCLSMLRPSVCVQVELGAKAGSLRQMLIELLEQTSDLRRITAIGRHCRVGKDGSLDCSTTSEKSLAEGEAGGPGVRSLDLGRGLRAWGLRVLMLGFWI